MTTLLSTPEIAFVESLTERCDSCSAAAKIEIVVRNGGTLAFCGHHANKNAAGLARVAGSVRVEEGFEWTGNVAS